MRSHYTPIRMTEIKKACNTKCCERFRATGTLIYFCWECKMLATLGNNLRVSDAVKYKFTVRPSNSTPSNLPERNVYV